MPGRFLVLLALAALGAVLAFNTLTYTSAQLRVEPAPRADIDTDAAAQRLATAISFRTISNQNPEDFEPEPFVALNAYLERTFPRHIPIRLFTVGYIERKSVYTTGTGTFRMWALARPPKNADCA